MATEGNKAATVIGGLTLVAAVFGLATWLADLTIPALGSLVNTDSFAQKNFVMKSFMLLLTLPAMWGLHKKLKLRYGFTAGENLNYGRFTKQAILLALAGLFSLIVLNVINFAITRKPPVGFPEEHLLARILFIWIWSSIVEEILFRGLFQSLIGRWNNTVFTFRKAPVSFAVLVSALAFAALHLFLLLQGMSILFVAGIFINTFLLGLFAGYLREKTGSLYPAVYVHILFNVVGSSPLILQLLLAK